MDALLDEDIKLVTCCGKAGTGKTLVSGDGLVSNPWGGQPLRARLHGRWSTSGKYQPLPGTLEEKMSPTLRLFMITSSPL